MQSERNSVRRGTVGAELTDDGIVLLIDYADKWSSCYDVFLYELDDNTVSCVENKAEYVKTYWPVKYQDSYSTAGNLSEEGKRALSDFVKDICNSKKLTDGTDVSVFMDALDEKYDDGRCRGYI